MNHIRIYPPGHSDGHPSKWYWEVRSQNDVVDCGKEETLGDALDAAGRMFLVAE